MVIKRILPIANTLKVDITLRKTVLYGFDDIIDYLAEEDLIVYEPVFIDKFDNDELINVYNCILKSNKVKKIAKIDIHNNLSKIGISDLSAPKRKLRYKL